MACNRPELGDYLTNFTGLDPVNSVVCPFAQSDGSGLGLGLALTTLLILGPLGLAMTVRLQHPGPLIVAGMLTIGAIATTLPGQAAQIGAIVFFFALAGIGLFIYQRMKTSL